MNRWPINPLAAFAVLTHHRSHERFARWALLLVSVGFIIATVLTVLSVPSVGWVIAGARVLGLVLSCLPLVVECVATLTARIRMQHALDQIRSVPHASGMLRQRYDHAVRSRRHNATLDRQIHWPLIGIYSLGFFLICVVTSIAPRMHILVVGCGLTLLVLACGWWCFHLVNKAQLEAYQAALVDAGALIEIDEADPSAP